MRLNYAVLFAFVMLLSPAAEAQSYEPEGERSYSVLDVQQRLHLQAALTASGHWNSVPTVDYTPRLHEAIRSQYDLLIMNSG